MALLGFSVPSSKLMTYASAEVSFSYLNAVPHIVSHMWNPEVYTSSMRLHPPVPCSE